MDDDLIFGHYQCSLDTTGSAALSMHTFLSMLPTFPPELAPNGRFPKVPMTYASTRLCDVSYRMDNMGSPHLILDWFSFDCVLC